MCFLLLLFFGRFRGLFFGRSTQLFMTSLHRYRLKPLTRIHVSQRNSNMSISWSAGCSPPDLLTSHEYPMLIGTGIVEEDLPLGVAPRQWSTREWERVIAAQATL